jgi:tRNA modification GTPase
MLGEDRAIVSEIPGTTRDVIEETLSIDGMVFRLMDTAGIRETTETIESLGIARSQEKIQRSRMIIALSDGSNIQQLQEDRKWVAELRRSHPDKFILWIANKADLVSEVDGVDQSLSALTGDGIEALKDSMSKCIKKDFDINQEVIVSNVRHWEALEKTFHSLVSVKNGLEHGLPADLVAMDIRAAMRTLGNITGEIELDTDILGTIFSRFCIGK